MVMYWPTPGFKGKTFQLCVLIREDIDFCVHSSQLRDFHWRFQPDMNNTSLELQVLIRHWTCFMCTQRPQVSAFAASRCSDHNLVHVLPRHRPIVQLQPPSHKNYWWTILARLWMGVLTVRTRAFFESSADVYEFTDAARGEQCIVPRRTLKVFTKKQSWLTKGISHMLNRK